MALRVLVEALRNAWDRLGEAVDKAEEAENESSLRRNGVLHAVMDSCRKRHRRY